MKIKPLLVICLTLLISTLSCRVFSVGDDTNELTEPTHAATRLAPTRPADVTRQAPAPGDDEPVAVSGEIPYTSPFFLATTAEPFVMLEDQAGFVRRDVEFEFPLASQVIGPVDTSQEGVLTFDLALPSIPQATYLDVDNDGDEDTGVQIFAVAYWSNTWGGPFLEQRDGTGWSTAYASTVVDPENKNEITGGTLVIWSPNDAQAFPTDFGPDGKLFTDDDPTAPVPAGYSLVDLDQRPFRVYKESHPMMTLNEGATAVNDYSNMDYADAFSALFDKASKEYPFTVEKGVDWDALGAEYTARAADVRSEADFYALMRDFALEIPDGHVGLALNQQAFFDAYGGGFGLVLAELSDGALLAAEVLPGMAAGNAGIQPGAQIIRWGGKSAAEALAAVTPGFGPASSQHAKRADQVRFLSRAAPGSHVEVVFRNPGADEQTVELTADVEYDSLFRSLPSFNADALALPVEAEVLPSGLGYITISTFSDDYNLMARVWERYIQNMIDNDVPGLILDLRNNGGGSLGMALQYAGYFFGEEIELYQNFYFNENTGKFEQTDYPTRIRPGPLYFDGPIAVLVGPNCVSACEGFAYAMQQQGRAVIVGHTPTAGAFGEVGQGQYKLPAEITMQLPTGRSVTIDSGAVVIEGAGVVPDVLVPVTLESALGRVDAVLEAAVREIQ